MALKPSSQFSPRPKRKTPAERSVEFDAIQARLKSEAAERRAAREAQPPARTR